MVKLLLERGTKKDPKDGHGQDVESRAKSVGKTEVIEELQKRREPSHWLSRFFDD